ncbi:MAG: glycosyltransferase family 4 protein [FCB group bacterium]|nr:glycosyltransferase family 4 protein [FCB group bacterium]
MPKKKLSDNVNAIVGISKFILDRHLKFGYFHHANIKTYIYNPINGIEKIPLRQNRKNNIVTFGYIGLLAPSKGIEYLLKHFYQIDLKKARLLVFGRGITPAYEKYLKDHYQQDNIIFMGFKKTEEIYPLLDVIVVPSLWEEPFGRIVPEAYVYGLPVIVSKRGGLPEIVDEGITGYIFDPDRENDFEKKLKLFLEDKELLNRLSENCLKKAREFSVEKVVEKYIDVYRRLG